MHRKSSESDKMKRRNSTEPAREDLDLSPKDHAVNATRAILKAVPWVGSSLEQFMFGPLTELRMRRIEKTLTEIGQTLKRENIPPSVDNEDFANLLEVVAPALSKATNEDRRQRFRDLLLNASQTRAGDASWEEAKLASDLLSKIDPPGLAILAAIARSASQSFLSLMSLPKPQVFEGAFDPRHPQLHHELGYEWPVVEEWARRIRTMRLIDWGEHMASVGYGRVQLTDLGKLLVRWIVRDRATVQPARRR